MIKVQHVIAGLIVLLAVSPYADGNNADVNEVEGFTKDDCKGDSHVAGNYAELQKMHKKKDNGWKFKSYWHTHDKTNCMEFDPDIEVLVHTSPRLPKGNISGGSGGSNSGGGGGIFPGSIFGENPSDPTDNEDLHKMSLCFLKKLREADLLDWTGEYTDATWQTDDAVQINSSRTPNILDKRLGTTQTSPDPVNSDKKGFAFATKKEDVSISTVLFINNISNFSKNYKVPYDHMLLYVMGHEIVHVSQALHERDDGDDQWVPWASGSWEREVEAHRLLDKFWDNVLGVPAPLFTPHGIEKPADWDANAEEYDNIIKKMKDGETLTRNEKKRKKTLEKYFKDNYPAAEKNKHYDYEAALNCDEEESKDSE